MNKLELVQADKDSNGLSKLEADSVVNLFFSVIATALARGERVKIAPKKLPFFKAGRELRERVDV